MKGILSPESWIAKSVVAVSHWPKQILGSSSEVLYLWMVICFAGVWIYLGTILILSLARMRPTLAAAGILGIIGGGLLPAILCWSGWLVVGIFKVLGVIGAFLFHILSVVFLFLAKVLVFIGPALIVIALIVGLILLWKAHGPKLIFSGAAGVLVLYYVIPLLKPIFEKIAQFLIWVLEALGHLLRWLPIVLLWLMKAFAVLLGITTIIGIVGCVGQILIDQFKTAVEAGRSQKGLFTASLSVGVSMALIFLVAAGSPEAVPVQAMSSASPSIQQWSSADYSTAVAKPKKRRKKRRVKKAAAVTPAPVVIAPVPVPLPEISDTIDRAWGRTALVFKTVSPTRVFLATLPAAIREEARDAFRTATAPTFDAVVLALVLALSLFGVVHSIFSRAEIEYKMRFYNKDLLVIAGVPIIVVLVMLFAQSAENQE